MKKILKLTIISFFLFGMTIGFSADFRFHGRASNSIYSYEDSESHTRVFQYVHFSLESPQLANMTLNTSFRALTDLNESLDADQRFKAYQLNLAFKKLFNRIDLVLGRQFLHPGTVLGGLDGLFAKFRITNNIYLSAYGGVEAHFHRSFQIYKFDDSFTTGGLVELNNFFNSKVQTFYLQKADQHDIFWQLAGLNFDSGLLPKTRFRFQGHYDLQNERFHRLLITARHQLTRKIALNLSFKNQYPQVYANSFYTIFEIDPYRQYRLGGSYQLTSDYFISAQYQLIQFESENANRVFLTLNSANGSIGLTYETGYAGDQLGVVFDYAYEIMPSLLASMNIDYTRYRTETVFEFENQLVNALRLSYRFQKNWSVDLEYQWLTNRFKDSDSRLLNHLHFSW
ncbi:MAG TPA: hypothetical protein ENN22_09885 [bacterium]|nr:hypothetical protein [bacterium]